MPAEERRLEAEIAAPVDSSGIDVSQGKWLRPQRFLRLRTGT